ncbi:MAG: GAF domain-containing protein, partial [Thermoleophilaceae bacterium]
MPREQDPGRGRFDQRRESGEQGELEGSGYEAIVLERLAKHASRIAGVDRTAIFVRDRRDPRVVIAAAGHGVGWDFAGSRLAADEGLVGDVLSEGGCYSSSDPAEIAPTLGDEGIYAGACAPIRSGAIVVGAICAISEQPDHTFDETDLELLEELGHVAAA